MEPRAEQLYLPKEYGSPKKKLAWDHVRKDLEEAPVYWVSSVRPDGRPHVVPRDGVWLDDTWYYGGSPKTVHNNNIEKNPEVVVHIGDGMKAIMVEGRSEFVKTDRPTGEKLAEMTNSKYAHYGYNNTYKEYTDRGIWAVTARRVIAWNVLFEDATRFVFAD